MAASSKASASHARLANHSSGAFSQSTPVGYARTMPGTAGVTVGTPRQLCRVPSQRWGTQNTVPRTSKTPFIGTHGRRFTAAKNASSSGTSCAPQPDVQSEDLATLASTSNKNASGLGVVVTSQANFLRVVVRPEGMSSAQQEAREFQLRNAAATARSAGKTQDAEVLEMNDALPKGQEKESAAKVKRLMTLMDSMTDEELDSTDLKMLQDPKRMERIGRGAGRGPGDIVELLEEYKRLAKMMGKMKGLKVPKKGGHGQQQALNQNLSQMASAIPPQMLKQMGGMGALQGMLKQLEGKDMGEMQKMMGKMMGGKGMPPGMGM